MFARWFLRRFAQPIAFVLVLINLSVSFAQVMSWTEDAENGLVHINDFTSASYSLIQSEMVSQGNNAFHLANPNFEDNWFEINQTISVSPTTNLFFSSQLGTATAEQIAKVQLSTDAGNTWPIDVFSQAGNGFPGEGTFGLKTVPLSDYAGQDLRMRFILDFEAPGSAFPQTDIGVGWIVDDIQITSSFDKTQYTIGDPSIDETLYLELINRSRADAIAEAERQANTTDPTLLATFNSLGIQPERIVAQYQWSVDNGCLDRHAQPLAFNERLLQASELHSQDQVSNNFQGHVSSNNPPLPIQPGDRVDQRLERVGYSFTRLGENVFAFADEPEHGHAGFEVDWGNATSTNDACYNPDFSNDGMQNPAGHRRNIHNAEMKEIGVGVVSKGNGENVVTQNLASPGNASFVTGVVYDDTNGNSFYDPGEGQAGVRVDIEGVGFFAISTSSGAYTIPVSSDGEYKVEFSGDGVSPFEVDINIQNGLNQKVDYVLNSTFTVAGDFNGDGVLDVADIDSLTLAVRAGDHPSLFDLNNDQLVDQADRSVWVDELKGTFFGDANLDGEFNSSDFVEVFQAGQYEDGIDQNSTWSTGDFNGDGEFDTSDFVLAFQSNGFEQGPRANVVPEPQIAIWFLIAPLLLLRYRVALVNPGDF